MLYFLYGTDRQRLQEVKRKVLLDTPSHSYDLSESSELARFKDFLRIQDMFGQTRHASVTHVFDSRQSPEFFRRDIISDPTLIITIIEPSSEKDLRKQNIELWNFFMTTQVTTIACMPLAFKDVQDWIKTYVQEHGLTITTPASQQLMQRLGLNQKTTEKPDSISRLQQELDKSIGYAFSQHTQTITPDIISKLVPVTADLMIFDFIDALGTRNIPQAFKLLRNHLQQLTDPHYILSMMLYQFRNLLIVKSLLEQHTIPEDITSKTKLHPYVVQKTIRQASHFSLPELKQYFKGLIALEGELKSGKVDEVDGLYLAVLTL